MKAELSLLAAFLTIGALRPPGVTGQLFLYPWLGLLPGLALVSWLMPRDSRAVRITLGICLSPLLATVIAWLLIRAGLPFRSAALAITAASALGFAAACLRPRMAAEPSLLRLPRGVLAVALGLAALLLAVPLINPYIFIRGDSWLHGGIVMELLERGFPPEDARMAGLHLNYVWFFNFFIALLASIHGQDPFPFMTLLNVANGFATVALVGLTARRLWGGDRAPLAAAALITLGLNAGAFLLWPLQLVRALAGEVTGFAEIARQIHNIEFGTARIIYDLSAPYAEMVSFLDKLLVGTALNFGYLHMTLFLWAMTSWLGDGRRIALLCLSLSAASMMFFHSVVGLSVVPMGLSVLGLAWLMRPRWRWLPARGALAWAATAVIAGTLVALPYTRSITSGWTPEKAGFAHRFLQFNPSLPWTLLSSCFFALILMRRPLIESWRARRPLPILMAAFAAGMAVFACFVNLPERNAVKFVYEFFTPCVLLAAPAFAETAERLWRDRRGLGMALALLFIVPAVLTVHGYLLDSTGNTRSFLHTGPGEAELYAWMRTTTPTHAVLVDRGYRDLISVRGRRRLFLGTDQPPERAAFPAPEMRRRQRVMTDLYGPLAAPDSTLAGLQSLGRPVYVLFRPDDPSAIPDPWQRLLEAAPGSRVVYDLDGYRVVRLPSGEGS
ncbi:MAG: hypothetical protein ABIS67_05425 [Candidatus Eisenbacteria bacterium]